MARGSKTKRTVLIGLGLDSDGIKRITTGPDFALVGGTEGTHGHLTEKTLKIKEKLAARGKTLRTVSPEEFADIADSVGLRQVDSEASE
jgi:hypothetical protein